MLFNKRPLTAVLSFSQTQKQTFKRIHVHHLIRTALYFVRIHVVSGTKTLAGDLFVCWCAHLGDSSFDRDSVMFERRIKLLALCPVFQSISEVEHRAKSCGGH